MVVVQRDSNPYWLFFNIGDSRVYRCADGVLAQVSVNHSMVQELVDEGRIEPEAN
jgi:protein phosphatase